MFATPTIQDVEHGMVNCNYRFALTGQTWQALREHYPDLVDHICVRGTIFARMSSDQKQQLIMELMRLGYYVGTQIKLEKEYRWKRNVKMIFVIVLLYY